MDNKKSIRFYKDHEVRAIWDVEQFQWWFSIVDIVAAVTESPNPRKYWNVLKTRLKKVGNELTTRCSQLKMTSADGKQYATDCFAQDDIIKLIRVIPSPKTADFLDWFIYSDNSSQYIVAQYVREHGRHIIDDAQSARTIVQINKEGNVVREFTSFLEICQTFFVPRVDNVRNVLNGKQKSAYGYYWKYKKDM